jgi:hypothetical protein
MFQVLANTGRGEGGGKWGFAFGESTETGRAKRELTAIAQLLIENHWRRLIVLADTRSILKALDDLGLEAEAPKLSMLCRVTAEAAGDGLLARVPAAASPDQEDGAAA